MTTSAAPTQPGTPALRCPMTGTGQRGPATVASTSPVRAGGADAGDHDGARAALVGERPQVGLGGQRRGLADLRAGRGDAPQHAARVVRGERRRRRRAGPRRRSRLPAHPGSAVDRTAHQVALRRAAARLVEQQHRDAVAHLEDPAALGAGQRLRRRVVVERGVVRVGAGQDLQQLRVEGHRAAPSDVCGCRRRCRPAAILSADEREHLVAQRRHPLRGRRLDVEPQQRLGVGRRAG